MSLIPFRGFFLTVVFLSRNANAKTAMRRPSSLSFPSFFCNLSTLILSFSLSLSLSSDSSFHFKYICERSFAARTNRVHGQFVSRWGRDAQLPFNCISSSRRISSVSRCENLDLLPNWTHWTHAGWMLALLRCVCCEHERQNLTFTCAAWENNVRSLNFVEDSD